MSEVVYIATDNQELFKEEYIKIGQNVFDIKYLDNGDEYKKHSWMGLRDITPDQTDYVNALHGEFENIYFQDFRGIYDIVDNPNVVKFKNGFLAFADFVKNVLNKGGKIYYLRSGLGTMGGKITNFKFAHKVVSISDLLSKYNKNKEIDELDEFIVYTFVL